MKVKKGGNTPPAGEEETDAAPALVDANNKLKEFFDAITNEEEEFPPDKLELVVKENYSTLNESIINKKKQQAIYTYLNDNNNNILDQYKTLLLKLFQPETSQEG